MQTTIVTTNDTYTFHFMGGPFDPHVRVHTESWAIQVFQNAAFHIEYMRYVPEMVWVSVCVSECMCE